MLSSIGIYQPYFKASIIERLDPGFIALDWLSNPTPALRELALHRYIATRNIPSRHQLTGLLSPKFFSKTGLRSQQVYAWIADNPGHEVYLINGGPYGPYTTYNSVERSKITHHPEFENWMRALCGTIGFALPKEFSRQNNANRCSCNYWIASRAFWESWVREVVAPLFEVMGSRNETDEIFGCIRYGSPTPAYNITFIYERLIDYFIAREKIDALYYPWDEQSVLSLNYSLPVKAYLEEMIPLVDRIDAKGPWSDGDKAWLNEQFATLNLSNVAAVLASDPVDFDLPRFSPRQQSAMAAMP